MLGYQQLSGPVLGCNHQLAMNTYAPSSSLWNKLSISVCILYICRAIRQDCGFIQRLIFPISIKWKHQSNILLEFYLDIMSRNLKSSGASSCSSLSIPAFDNLTFSPWYCIVPVKRIVFLPFRTEDYAGWRNFSHSFCCLLAIKSFHHLVKCFEWVFNFW